jgi:cytochrome c-type biogenesis protein CcmH
MLTFPVVAALCVVLALVFLVTPLLRRPTSGVSSETANVAVYRDQLAELDADVARGTLSPERHAEARAEIEQRLAEDLASREATRVVESRAGRRLAMALAVLLPAAAIGIYLGLGNPAALDPAKRLGMSEQEAAERQKMLELTAKLARRMEEKPDDPVGWRMLGRAYRAVGKMRESVRAYQRSMALDPRSPEAYVDAAETLALMEGGRIGAEAAAMASKALSLDERNEKALALLGTAAFEAGDFKRAIELWQRLREFAPEGSDYARAIDGGIAEAKRALSETKGGGAAAAAGPSLAGSVTLGPGMAGKAPPEATVFVFARAVEGPKMPLAVVRRQVKDLPFEFRLDDSMSMVPGMKLSAQARVIVGARVSLSGNPVPGSGDLEGMTEPVAPGAAGLKIVIDRQVP